MVVFYALCDGGTLFDLPPADQCMRERLGPAWGRLTFRLSSGILNTCGPGGAGVRKETPSVGN